MLLGLEPHRQGVDGRLAGSPAGGAISEREASASGADAIAHTSTAIVDSDACRVPSSRATRACRATALRTASNGVESGRSNVRSRPSGPSPAAPAAVVVAALARSLAAGMPWKNARANDESTTRNSMRSPDFSSSRANPAPMDIPSGPIPHPPYPPALANGAPGATSQSVPEGRAFGTSYGVIVPQPGCRRPRERGAPRGGQRRLGCMRNYGDSVDSATGRAWGRGVVGAARPLCKRTSAGAFAATTPSNARNAFNGSQRRSIEVLPILESLRATTPWCSRPHTLRWLSNGCGDGAAQL